MEEKRTHLSSFHHITDDFSLPLTVFLPQISDFLPFPTPFFPLDRPLFTSLFGKIIKMTLQLFPHILQ